MNQELRTTCFYAIIVIWISSFVFFSMSAWGPTKIQNGWDYFMVEKNKRITDAWGIQGLIVIGLATTLSIIYYWTYKR